MFKSERIVGFAIFCALAGLLAVLVVSAGVSEQHNGFQKSHEVQSVQVQTEDGVDSYALPCSIGGLSPHSSATMTFDANVDPGDVLLLHSVYTSYKVYADDVLIASFGADDAPPPRVYVGPADRSARHPA